MSDFSYRDGTGEVACKVPKIFPRFMHTSLCITRIDESKERLFYLGDSVHAMSGLGTVNGT